LLLFCGVDVGERPFEQIHVVYLREAVFEQFLVDGTVPRRHDSL
jgi:hypothetical protein